MNLFLIHFFFPFIFINFPSFSLKTNEWKIKIIVGSEELRIIAIDLFGDGVSVKVIDDLTKAFNELHSDNTYVAYLAHYLCRVCFFLFYFIYHFKNLILCIILNVIYLIE